MSRCPKSQGILLLDSDTFRAEDVVGSGEKNGIGENEDSETCVTESDDKEIVKAMCLWEASNQPISDGKQCQLEEEDAVGFARDRSEGSVENEIEKIHVRIGNR